MSISIILLPIPIRMTSFYFKVLKLFSEDLCTHTLQASTKRVHWPPRLMFSLFTVLSLTPLFMSDISFPSTRGQIVRHESSDLLQTIYLTVELFRDQIHTIFDQALPNKFVSKFHAMLNNCSLFWEFMLMGTPDVYYYLSISVCFISFPPLEQL